MLYLFNANTFVKQNDINHQTNQDINIDINKEEQINLYKDIFEDDEDFMNNIDNVNLDPRLLQEDSTIFMTHEEMINNREASQELPDLLISNSREPSTDIPSHPLPKNTQNTIRSPKSHPVSTVKRSTRIKPTADSIKRVALDESSHSSKKSKVNHFNIVFFQRHP
jgi:hypothetical protein